MKDMQDHFQEHSEDENNHQDINKNQEGMEQKNENCENDKKSTTPCEKVYEENQTNHGAQEENLAQKDEAFAPFCQTTAEEGKEVQAQDQAVHEAVQENKICQEAEEAVLKDSGSVAKNAGQETSSTPQYSCSYTPPYYVPNFTVASPSSGERGSKARKPEKSFGGGLIALVVVIALVVSVAGGWIGYMLGQNANLTNSAGGDSSNSMTVIKNDGSIKVNEVVGSTGYSGLSVSEVVSLVADSVVEITTTQVQTDPFYGNYVTGGAGSGVIIDQEGTGYIITNHHVIDGADQILVRLTDGSEYEATCLGSDADYDIAVLKIQASGLTFATMGSSSSLKVGQEVVAIGNPLGELGGTVTDGIISALDRNLIVDGHRMTLLQTNAAINPGNSGGGLFDMGGNLIGIVNAKQADTGIEGLGFAIPIDVAWDVAQDIIQYGYVVGKLALDFDVTEYTSEFSLQVDMSVYTMPKGVYIAQSSNGNLKAYDRIKSLNGTEIQDISDYYSIVDQLKEGDSLTLVVQRLHSGFFVTKFQEHEVTLAVSFTKPPSQ